jgi:hypothetical protein
MQVLNTASCFPTRSCGLADHGRHWRKDVELHVRSCICGRGAWSWLHGRIVLQPSPIRSRECGDSSDRDQKILRGWLALALPVRVAKRMSKWIRTPSPKSSKKRTTVCRGSPQLAVKSPKSLSVCTVVRFAAAIRGRREARGVVRALRCSGGTLGGAETSTIHPACIAAGPHLYVSFVSSNTCP